MSAVTYLGHAPDPSTKSDKPNIMSDLFGDFGVSPLGLKVEIEDYKSTLVRHELREMLRGLAGALFVALPLLYTQEMWERARSISPEVLIAILVLAYALNVGYCAYSGYKVARSRSYIIWDAFVAIGIGMTASIITLFLTARVNVNTPLEVVLNLVALMAVPTSFGASLAINQLGKREYNDRKTESPAAAHLSEDGLKVTGTVLGGTLFAFNIMPTIEPKVMMVEIGPLHALGIVVFSLMISYGIEFMARFHDGATDQAQGVLAEAWLTTLFCYLVSLIASAVLLWMFGYLGTTTPPEMWVMWVVIVGYAATLGGTAGRLVL